MTDRGSKPTYSIVVEATLFRGEFKDAHVRAERDAINTVERLFNEAGYRSVSSVHLDTVSAKPSYIYRNLASSPVDVLWIEGHGSPLQGVTALPLEDIAEIRDLETPEWGGRLKVRCLIFGSCHSGLSRLRQTLPRLLEQPTVVVTSTEEVRFSDGKHYADLIGVWLKLESGPPEALVTGLNSVAPDLLQAVVITPDYS